MSGIRHRDGTQDQTKNLCNNHSEPQKPQSCSNPIEGLVDTVSLQSGSNDLWAKETERVEGELVKLSR